MPPPQPGTEDHPEDHPEAGAGAVSRLTEGEAVGVVFHPYLAFEREADVVVEAVTVQRDGVGVLDQPGGRADYPGDADPDGAADAQVRFTVAHQGSKRRHGLVVAQRGADALAPGLGAIGSEDRDLDLAAAEVDADARMVHGVR